MSNRDNLNKIIARNLARAISGNVLVQITLRRGTVLHGTITPGHVTWEGDLKEIVLHQRAPHRTNRRIKVDDIKSLTIINS